MATERAVKKQSAKDYTEIIARPWGLGRCKEQHGCKVCESYHGTPTLKLMRDFFVAGMPPEYIPAVFEGPKGDLEKSDIYTHGYRQQWHTKRKQVQNVVVSNDMMALMFMRRFMDSQHVVSGTSADKSLENLMKLAGLGKETHEIKGSVSFSWEQQMTKHRENPGVIMIEDDLATEPVFSGDIEVSEAIEGEYVAAD